MKPIIYLLIAFAGWQYYQKHYATSSPEGSSEYQAFQPVASNTQQSIETFTCDGRQHCSQMRSRAEAEFFLRSCPNTKMDGDHDGVPCENDSRF